MTVSHSPNTPYICVYCGSQDGTDPAFIETARILGEEIGKNGLNLVYGGGDIGLMGAVADAASINGAFVTGIIPNFLADRENIKTDMGENGETIRTSSMHERKHLMFEKADAFVALPGGIGTLEEIVEIMTWAQLGRHEKPIAFANVKGFWDPLLSLVNQMKEAGFLHSVEKLKPLVIDDPKTIIASLVPLISTAHSEGDESIIARL